MDADNSRALLKQYYIQIAHDIDKDTSEKCDILKAFKTTIQQKINLLECDQKITDKLSVQLEKLKEKNREVIKSQMNEKTNSLNERKAYLNAQVRTKSDDLERIRNELEDTNEKIRETQLNKTMDEKNYDKILADISGTCDSYFYVLDIDPSVSQVEDQSRISIRFQDIEKESAPITFKIVGDRIHAEGTPVPISADLNNGHELRTFILRIRRLFM